MKILIVDDSRSVHALVEEMLGSQYTFQHSYNGKEALGVVNEVNFKADLILLDWEMPEMSGIEALPELKKAKPELTILMMTSKNSMENIMEALSKGAADYIIKPFTKDIILGKIESLNLGVK